MNDLITTEIRGRKIVYFLTSKDDLDSLKGRSIFSDICLCLFSLCIGGLLTIAAGRELTVSAIPATVLKDLQIANIFLGLGACIFIIFYSVVTFQIFRNISNINNSGAISSFSENVEKKITDELLVIHAEYYTLHKQVDVTDEISSLVQNNTLHFLVSNEMTGKNIDPEPGVVKDFKIKYSYNNKTFERDYKEGNTLDLP